jgi:hypothetical protein
MQKQCDRHKSFARTVGHNFRTEMRKLLPFILVIAILHSCDNEIENQGGHTHYLISDNLFPLIFADHSLWVYQNQTNLLLDSITVESVDFDTTESHSIGKGYSANYEKCIVNYKSILFGEYSDIFIASVIRRGTEDGGGIYKSNFIVGDYFNNAIIAEIHDSIKIDEVTYHRVVEMAISKAEYIENDMKLFFKDSVGIVKKVLYNNSIDSTCWELVSRKTKLYYD